MQPRAVRIALVAVALSAGVVATAPPALAGGDIPVTTTADELNGGTNGTSLRDAVDIVNDDGNSERVITLVSGATYQLTRCDGSPTAQEDANDTGDLDLVDNERIMFLGEATIEQTCPGERVIDSLGTSSTLAVARATVTGGETNGNGGGLRSQGDVEVILFASVEGNTAPFGQGGGAWALDDVFVTQSTLRNNTAGTVGGGAHAADGVIVDLSAITGNTSGLIGGGASAGHNLLVEQSTISRNRSAIGGGVQAQDALDVTTSTLLANRADDGANLSTSGTLEITASVNALGSDGPDCDIPSLGAATSGGYNLGDDSSCGNNAPGDNDADHPMLSALNPTSGRSPTASHRPVAQSPVLNRDPAPCVGEVDDQFHVDRPSGAGCETGSYEEANPRPCSQSFPDVPTSSDFFADICWLRQMDITGGFPDGTFKPTNAVSRQSMAAFLFRLAGAPPFPAPSSASFPDVPTTSDFFTEIEWLADEEITGGFPDLGYHPTQAVSRQAMAAFLYRVAGEPTFVDPPTASFPDVPTTSNFFTEIEWLVDEEVAEGYPGGLFKPANAVSRQAMAAFLLRMADDVTLAGL